MSQAEIEELPIDAPMAEGREEAPEEPAPLEEEPAPREEEPAPQEEEPAPPEVKPKRGRPPGSKNKEARAKAAPKPKAKAKNTAPPPSEDEEPLPQYVQESLDQPSMDLTARLFGLLQSHERQRVDRRRATYASWVNRF